MLLTFKQRHGVTWGLPEFVFFLLPFPFLQYEGFTLPMLIAVLYCGFLVIQKRYPLDKYMLFSFGLFIIGEVLSLFQCPDLGKSISNSAQKILILFLLYPLMAASLKNKERIDKSLRLYRIACLIMAAMCLAKQLSIVSFPFIGTKFAAHRLTIGGLGPNVIARMFIIGAFSSLYEAQIQSGKKTAFHYGECIVITSGAMATISTSGILLFVVGAMWIFLSFNRGVRRIGLLKVISVLVLAFIAAFILYRFSPFVQKTVDGLILREQQNKLIDDENTGYSMHGRLSELSVIAENFFRYSLVGIGYGCSGYYTGVTIHFPLISAWVETGILGFASCCFLYGYPAWCAVKLLKRPDYAFFSIISLIMIVGDMVQPNPNYWFTWYAIFLPCIAYLCHSKEKK